jgi:hypothetical protein
MLRHSREHFGIVEVAQDQLRALRNSRGVQDQQGAMMISRGLSGPAERAQEKQRSFRNSRG